MSNYLVIDAAFPGDSRSIVAAAKAAGAFGVAGYLRNWSEWTSDVAWAIMNAGLGFLPIELYNGPSQAPMDTLAILAAWRLPKGPVALDVEVGSWPSDAWQLQWQRVIDGAGWTSVGYSQAALSVPWRKRWRAQYTWAGQPDQRTIQPVQAIPSSQDAVQYAHAISVAGVEVDVSNFSFPLIGGTMIDPARIDAIFNYTKGGYYGDQADSATYQIKTALQAVLAKLGVQDQELQQLIATPVDPVALATALAPHLPAAVDQKQLATAIKAALASLGT